MEPELAAQAALQRSTDNIQIADADDMAQWCQWVMAVAAALPCRRLRLTHSRDLSAAIPLYR